MRWWHRAEDVSRTADDVGHDEDQPATCDNEFDAYLAGEYAEWLASRGQAVPSWAWVNRIAHGSRDELRRVATTNAPSVLRGEANLWQVLIGFLANEVLAKTADDTQLAAVQRDALVPLELRLAERWWVSFAPADVATAVLVALQTP